MREPLKVTADGCIPLPPQVRDLLKFVPNVELELEIAGDTLIVKKVKKTSGHSEFLISIMRGRATAKMSTEEIMSLTRGD